VRSASETISKVRSASEQKKLIKVIQNDVERINRLINDISAASRLDSELSRIEMKNVNISNLLETLVDVRSSTVECNINFLKYSEDMYIFGNENKIAQVFDNLIQNAVSFSTDKQIINIRLEKSLEHVIILVEDSGPGFSNGSLNKVFDRFYTDRPKNEKFGNHSGLGLSISKQIVLAHGGTIEALNRFNQKNECVGGSVKVSFLEI
jgi:two-component system sensor histidine kinase ChvG